MRITREWAMPNSKTFKIKPIREIIKKYVKETDIVLDPFANEHSIESEIICKKYISNDIDKTFNTDYHLEAQDFLRLFDDNSIDVVLFDPPYSRKAGKRVLQQVRKDSNNE